LSSSNKNFKNKRKMKKQVLVLTLGLFSILFTQAQTAVSVSEIQFVSATDLADCKDLSAYDGQTIKTIGRVVHDGGLTEVSSSGARAFRPGVHLVDTGVSTPGGFKGLQIHGVTDGGQGDRVDAINTLVAGMLVEITGIVGSYSGETQLYPIDNSSVNVLSLGTAPLPDTLDLSLLNDNARVNILTTGEEYEGSFVSIKNVTVVSVNIFNGNRLSFDVSDENGNLINVSDRFMVQKLSLWTSVNAQTPNDMGTFVAPIVGTKYASLSGIIVHSENGCTGGGANNRGYEMNPFDTSHYQIGDSPPSITQVTRNPLVPAGTDAVTIACKIIDFNGTVDDQKLYYSTGLSQDNNVFNAVALTLKGGSSDEFEATIPAFADGTIVRYYITATDNDGNVSYVPFTASNATGATAFYTVRDAGLTIVDLQYVLDPSSDASPYRDQEVTVKGYITASAKPYDLEDIYMQDIDATEWAGIKLTGNADLLSLWRTQEVEVTGVVEEVFGFTQLVVSSVSKTGKTAEITPVEIPVSDSAGRENRGLEKYEGMLVKMVNSGGKVKISNPRLNPFGEWTVANDVNSSFANSTKVQSGVKNGNNNSSLWVSVVAHDTFALIDGLMEVPVVEATKEMDMDAIIGVIYYGFDEYALKPRNNDDLVGFSVELDSTDYPEIVSVQSFKELGMSFYPNPATSVINVTIENNAQGTLRVRSLEGRLVAESVLLASTSVDVSALTNGIYIIEFTSKEGRRASAKFVKL
jgi:hypothetical protein